MNGCFWHGHKGCKYFVWPKNNADFWGEKVGSNILRDAKTLTALNAVGWRVITIGECELKAKKQQSTLNSLAEALQTP